jgi:hypothetical protein
MSVDEIQRRYDEAEASAQVAREGEGEGSVAYRDARAISERWRRALGKQRSMAAGSSPSAIAPTHFTASVRPLTHSPDCLADSHSFT